MFHIINDLVTATVSPKGGELISLFKEGVEYLWQGDAAYWSGHSPVCFPIVGGLPGGTVSAMGKICTMPRHGIARTQTFHLLSREEDSICFRLTSNEDTYRQYPFHFELDVRYQLHRNTITVQYEVRNCGDTPMPFAIGGHPAFRCPILAGEPFEEYQIFFCKAEEKPPLRTNPQTGFVDRTRQSKLRLDHRRLSLEHSLFYEDALIFEDIASKEVTLRSGTSSRGVRVNFEDFSNLLLWSSRNNGPFIAIEPWSAMPPLTGAETALEDRKGYLTLPCGKQKAFTYQIQLL